MSDGGYEDRRMKIRTKFKTNEDGKKVGKDWTSRNGSTHVKESYLTLQENITDANFETW